MRVTVVVCMMFVDELGAARRRVFVISRICAPVRSSTNTLVWVSPSSGEYDDAFDLTVVVVFGMDDEEERDFEALVNGDADDERDLA